eukprot:4163840-Pleurochrysis_carterae.AAC.1
MQVGVEHDRREGHRIRAICVLERPWVGLELGFGEGLQDAVDLLRLAGEAERLEELAQRLVEGEPRKVEADDEVAQQRLRREKTQRRGRPGRSKAGFALCRLS